MWLKPCLVQDDGDDYGPGLGASLKTVLGKPFLEYLDKPPPVAFAVSEAGTAVFSVEIFIGR
ncbi:hypothetical protein CU048_13795 [Beijerinckiaceae bacterium]|nr:hypothetical protein CU048_13795 [Beijerinckiaceae bacterium]